MGVSKNNSTPKSSVLIGFSIINHPFWGTTIFGNTQIDEVSIAMDHLLASLWFHRFFAQLWLFILGFILLALILGLILWLFSVRFPSRSSPAAVGFMVDELIMLVPLIWTTGLWDDKEGHRRCKLFFERQEIVAWFGRCAMILERFWRSLFFWDIPGPWPSHGCIMAHGMHVNNAGLFYSKSWDKGGPIPKAWRSGDGPWR